MHILAIETSCDDTSIATFDTGNLVQLITRNQHKYHRPHHGIVPEVASRQHGSHIHRLIDECLDKSQWNWSTIDAIAVTYGPGLEGALLVGLTTAKTLAYTLSRPLIPVNHLHGHVYSAFMDTLPPFPFVALLVSGGHCLLARFTDYFKCSLLGQTRDDAVGEAFDKVARLLGLRYPGGPEIDALAKTGDSTRVHLPKGLHQKGLDFSYSGLKSAVFRCLKSDPPPPAADVAASFQKAACDSLIDKALPACLDTGTPDLVVCGGVSANSYLRTALLEQGTAKGIQVHTAPLAYCTDNAAMIGRAAHFMQLANYSISTPITATPSLTL
ncbi:MAG: tRNA (adenosine(37)-N6)-threonylcarbamoyltransferase complex transferase subunit TsaD [Candidatus Marinamargulisbacteria bacterium]|jgi:N6-L-threonylcarbamoyladenine synthase|nr:tRNA (adenosine(37)-N6)-threonylcarbamoyltransferase complex transferase subunit TsaD [Candidatus Marinamargulisbacteria bacterium]